ncbi:hypothetical protein MNEG_8565 [Monoraphidium neglectum]|uniref:Uncharacterized protein n=1 Tax=Monoraphidium neglectum TaxID=145388 RepID=A0A0D2JJ99_9CHLO|nr:hypothetical protein MNEG_8565 [Monoraphidium neglectum]KIY99397.1 hypothetical protein MNEG_8565 [Monoraphidium neglectum]|eukprot:XP_013898417.1 hypothetical protein MNEG_8565 [Monoraphidium neglectum]
MGNSLRNSSNRPVPVQTVKSKIASLAGPEAAVAPGASAAFTWETQGYGEQFCYVDGARIANSADRIHCESPLNLRVADAGNHTLEVVLLDVCGQTVANGLFFGSWGWRPNIRFTPPAPPPPPVDASGAAVAPAAMPAPLARPANRTRRESAAGSAKRWRAAGATALAGAAALALAL